MGGDEASSGTNVVLLFLDVFSQEEYTVQLVRGVRILQQAKAVISSKYRAVNVVRKMKEKGLV